jgi:hypothetical protein
MQQFPPSLLPSQQRETSAVSAGSHIASVTNTNVSDDVQKRLSWIQIEKIQK